ncbi:11038_t:CDS:1, partial [Racocetra persica]
FIDDAKKLNPKIIDFNKSTKEAEFNSNSSHNSLTLESRQIGISLLGGTGIMHNHRNVFSAGFWVRSRGLTYLVTCGHCAAGGTKNPDGFIDFYYTPWNDVSNFSPEDYIGPMTMSDVAVVDRAFILRNNSRFIPSPNIKNSDFRVYPELQISDVILGPDQSMIGLPVCKSGYRTHVLCGELRSVNAKIIQSGKNYENMILTSHIGKQGDSGAPVFIFSDVFALGPLRVHLIGMLSGTSESDTFNSVTPIFKILKDN